MEIIGRPGFILPGIEDIMRRDFLVGGAATLLLAGCGSSGGNGEASGESRTVEDGSGRSVEVPVNPERVVVVDPNRVLFHLVELGLVPVGATTNVSTLEGNFPPLLGEGRGEVEPIGDVGSPSLERISTLDPDLILYTGGYSGIDAESLSEIAPTVVYDQQGIALDTERSLRFVAEIVNRQEEAERLISDFDERLEEAASTLDLEGRTFSVPLLFTGDPTFNIYGPD